MIGSILVPVDGSNHALRAVEFAADLAQKYGTRLIVVHVTTHLGSGHVAEELREHARIDCADMSDTELLKSAATAMVNEAQTKVIRR